MKLCRDCKHFNKIDFGIDGRWSVCMLKSKAVETDYETGTKRYNTYSVVEIENERTDSTGIFGFFKDATRCGHSAKNFEPKKER